MNIMSLIPHLSSVKLTRIKLVLLVSFSFLMLMQFIVGFESFEDYLIVFVYALFLNDLYTKLAAPLHMESFERSHKDPFKISRSTMSIVFMVLFTLPFILDAFNVGVGTRLFIYKVGFVLWGQLFVINAYMNYRMTKSKHWLAITIIASMIIVLGSLF